MQMTRRVVYRRILLLLSAFLSPFSNCPASDMVDSPPSTTSVKDLVLLLQQRNQLIKQAPCLLIEYHVESSTKLSDTKYGHPFDSSDFSFQLGLSNGKWMTSVTERTRGSPVESLTRKGVFQRGMFAEKYKKGITIAPEPTGHLYIWWHYTQNIGFDAFQEIRQDLSESHFATVAMRHKYLPTCIEENIDDYKLSIAAKPLERCVFLEREGHDRLWFDLSLAGALVQREIFWDGKRPKNILRNRYFFEDFVELLPNLWLPRRHIVETFADPKLEEERFWNQKSNVTVYVATKISGDAIPDELFNISAAAGDRVVDLARNRRYIIESDVQVPLQRALDFGSQWEKDELLRPRKRHVWFLIINIVVCIVLLGFLLFKTVAARK